MAENVNLNKLVSALSIEERHNLLERLHTHSNFSGRVLYEDETGRMSSEDIETEYSKLSWVTRLWYFFISLFKSKPPIKIFEDNKVSMLGNKIQERTPGLYDYHKNMLLPLFHHYMAKLKEAAHFFYAALDSSVNRDKAGFFAFLASLEMPEVHKKLQDEANPFAIAENNPDMPETEVRQEALKIMEDALSMMTEENRNAMYHNARSLFCLKGLSSFLYERVLMAFSARTAENGETCFASAVRELLISLNNILSSLKVVPPMPLLESLFVFILQERIGEHGFDINREIRALLLKAEESLAVIHDFNRHVPLTMILRCSTRNMSLSPRESSGGEEWYVIYRDYWKRHIESIYAEYLKEHRQKELMGSFRVFFKGKEFRPIGNVQTDSNREGIPIRGAFALSFLYTFYPVIFIPEINWVLRPILIEGEFQKKENRMEFDEGYNNLIKLEDEIKKLEQDISATGDYYKRYIQARQDMSALPIKRRKMQIAIEEAEEDVNKILEQIKTASQIMVNILGGIIGKDIRGKYFPMTNLPKVAGKNSKFVPGISEVIQKFQFVLKVLNDIEIMESGR
jgi:hypothetical protein